MTGARPLSPEEFQIVMARARGRDLILCAVLGYLGPRLSEALALTCGDVLEGRTVRQEVRFRRANTKGQRTGRVVPVHPQLARLLEIHLLGHNPLFVPPDRPLIPGDAGRLSRSQGHRVITSLLKGFAPEVSSHSFRKFFASQLLRSPHCNLAIVADLLGHADLRTTAVYLELDPAQIRASVLSLPELQQPTLPLLARPGLSLTRD